MSGLKRLLNTLFFPTIWIADHLGMLKKLLLFLSLNLVAPSCLSIVYWSEFGTDLECAYKALYITNEQNQNRVIDL
jgi:hypothetical protein